MYDTQGCVELPDKLPYSAIIGKHVRKGIISGVSIKDIMASIQKFQHAPASTSSFYKLYGADIAEVKFDTSSAIGNVVVQQAMAGDFKAAEFYLRSKGGWSPTSTVEEREVGSEEEEDRSAVEDIMARLGKFNDEPDEETNG